MHSAATRRIDNDVPVRLARARTSSDKTMMIPRGPLERGQLGAAAGSPAQPSPPGADAKHKHLLAPSGDDRGKKQEPQDYGKIFSGRWPTNAAGPWGGWKRDGCGGHGMRHSRPSICRALLHTREHSRGCSSPTMRALWWKVSGKSTSIQCLGALHRLRPHRSNRRCQKTNFSADLGEDPGTERHRLSLQLISHARSEPNMFSGLCMTRMQLTIILPAIFSGVYLAVGRMLKPHAALARTTCVV